MLDFNIPPNQGSFNSLQNLDASEVRGAEVDWETKMSPFSFCTRGLRWLQLIPAY